MSVKGIWMKKYLIIICVELLCINAYAGWDPKGSGDMSCMVEKKDSKHYYFCGARSEDWCAGYKLKKQFMRTTVLHGNSFTSERNSSLKYWCCGGTNTNSGHFVKSNQWYKTNKVVTVTLDNGTCNYTQKINVCDEEESTPCTTPDNCTNGRVLHGGQCVTPCNDGEVFENATSGTCIPCETTNRQGIVGDKCIKCNDAQFFDRQKGKCIEKSALKSFDKLVMKQCYACPNKDVFAKCVEIFNMPAENRKSVSGYSGVMSQCLIKNDE